MHSLTTHVLVDSTHGLRFAESPRWHDGQWWFVDIHDKGIKRVGLDGVVEKVLDLPFLPNALGFRSDGSMVFTDGLGLTVHSWDGQEVRQVADLHGQAVACLSDGIVDAQDRFFVGDIGYPFFDPTLSPVDTCVIVRVDPDGTSRVVADRLTFPNGMVLTPDARTLIVAETYAHRLTAFDVTADGDLTNRRVFAQLSEDVHPDGIALDAEGAVWLACPEAEPTVRRVREGGEVVETVELDRHAYAVMLGGPERRHLLVCASRTHNPAEIAASPSANLRVVEVEVPGAGRP
jgi:sugar lactone lactonase YvrE